MSNDVTPTWPTRELPILKAALKRLDAGDPLTAIEGIRAEIGLDAPQMRAGLKALENAFPPYIEVQFTLTGPDNVGGHITGITERTRRELGSWPSPTSVVDQLVQALTAAAETETEPEKKGRLRATADALGGFARDVAVGVVAARMGNL